MNLEIERKFLVNQKFSKDLLDHQGVHIWQAYLYSENYKTIRIRQKGENAFITIKSGNNLLSRKEFEYEIPLSDLNKLKVEFENSPSIEKTRYTHEYKGHTWEIDVFQGNNEGLILCEIELKSEQQEFLKPDWIGEEVTHNPNYLNSNLAEKTS